jgi:hypothetical protein
MLATSVAGRIDAMQGVRPGAADPHRIVADGDPVGRLAKGEDRRRLQLADRPLHLRVRRQQRKQGKQRRRAGWESHMNLR